MKRHSPLPGFLLALTLVACSGSKSPAACTQQYWDGTVGVCLPANWEVVPQETLTQRGMPEAVLAAFQSKDDISGQKPTVTITQETLTSPITATAYSDASIQSVTSLPSFKQVDRRAFKWNGQALQIHIFTAQPLPDQPARKFFQLSLVSNNVGYTLTGFTPVSVASTVESQVLTILQSVTFTSPTTSSK